MKNQFLMSISVMVLMGMMFQSCKKEGCTDPKAINFNSSAKSDDGSCNYITGCMDPDGTNYNPNATKDDGSCNYILGCTDPTSTNYNPSATKDDGNCEYNGKVVFWTNADVGCGLIDVTVEGIAVGQVSTFYNTSPDCDANGCVTLELPVGTYSYSASDNCGSWDGTVTLTANGCTGLELNQ